MSYANTTAPSTPSAMSTASARWDLVVSGERASSDAHDVTIAIAAHTLTHGFIFIVPMTPTPVCHIAPLRS
jgi:hypothetical protein